MVGNSAIDEGRKGDKNCHCSCAGNDHASAPIVYTARTGRICQWMQFREPATDESVQSFSSRYLFGPLGISDYDWAVLQPSGITCCHGDIHITPRDMAKLGQLFLDGGTWKGTRVISMEWVERSTQHHINPMVPWADGYGYLWWLRNLRINNNTVRSFKAMGWGGQEIFVVKDLAMVVVSTGANYVGSVPCDEIMQRYALPAAGI